jgi:hypothetical protein
MHHKLLFTTAVTAMFAGGLALYGCTPPVTNVQPEEIKSCEKHSECADGFVCEAGQCRPGECAPGVADQCNLDDTPADIAPYCCKVWQLCNSLNECAPNPDSPVDTQCEVDDDCPNLGEFCSGGRCYGTAGRQSCTASFQCDAGERCDRTVFLCVPDIGGCDLADQGFPELACEEGQLCDQETGFCVDPGEAECTADTVETDCRPSQQCDVYGRCVQCIDSEDCGPGTSCNEGTGQCVSDVNSCESDDDCPGDGRRCNLNIGECVRPQCERDADCEDSREQCDLGNFVCVLPPAVCTDEADEPNDSVGAATAIMDGYAGTVCRGNTDYLSFPINPAKRYRVTISFPDFNTEGIQVGLLDTNGGLVDQSTFGSFDNEVTVTGISDDMEAGPWVVRVIGSGTEEDIWSYTVDIEETNAPMQVDCADETSSGVEPNNTFADAYVVMPNSSTSYARCGSSDVDYYKVTVPALNGIEVTMEHETEDGDMDVYLYDEEDGSSVDSSTSGNAVEKVEAQEGATTFWIKVQLWPSDSDANTNQTYTLTVNAIPRPDTCDPDVNEPDGSTDTAGALALTNQAGSADAIRCGSVDVDHWAITVPANEGGQVAVDFTHTEGDLILELLDSDGNELDEANDSSSGDTGGSTEILPIPPSGSEQTYYAKVRLFGSSGITAQSYTIRASTFDASACTTSEPVLNDTFAEGTCFSSPTVTDSPVIDMTAGDAACAETRTPPGTWPTLTACENATTRTDGCGSVCGVGDVDYYRVGRLAADGAGDRLLSAVLEHTASEGVLSLAIVRRSPSGEIAKVDYAPNDAQDNVLTVDAVVPDLGSPAFAREWGVVVEPTGAAGDYMAQPYSLRIDVGPGCPPDNNDAAARNDTPGTSTPVSLSGGSANVTGDNARLCGNDVDVYRIIASAGDTITATLTGLDGATVDIGLPVPGDFSAPAEPLACGGGCVDGGVPDISGFTSPVTATLNSAPNDDSYYLTVHRDPVSGELGSYTLNISVN